MAHRCKVDGTNYNVIGGRCRVDGTSYKIIGGKTKVDGTAYSIRFGKTLTISKSNDYCWVSVDGKEKPDGTYEYNDDTVIKVYVYASDDAYLSSCKLYLNGTVVKSGSGLYTLSNVSSYNTITIKFTNIESSYYFGYITTT